MELARVGAKTAGPQARAQLDLSRPDTDFVQIATGLGVSSVRVSDAEGLIEALEIAAAEPGPHLIEAVIPSTLTPLQVRAMPYALRVLDRLPQPVAAAVKKRFYP
jgi:acetolactate synthase-1/2/3 large subunit